MSETKEVKIQVMNKLPLAKKNCRIPILLFESYKPVDYQYSSSNRKKDTFTIITFQSRAINNTSLYLARLFENMDTGDKLYCNAHWYDHSCTAQGANWVS